MPDTIFYHLKLKRGRRPQEVFEKMAKAIKKRGATKNWSYTINEEEETFLVDFGDELSEGFGIHFEKQVADDCCKVYFPLDGELYEDEKKSEFKALLNMIYSARTSFSRMEITDDYGLAEDFMESKKFKLKLRELTEEEMERAKRLYNLGYTAHPDFVLKLIYDYLEIPFDEEYEKYVNQKVSCTRYDLEDQKFLRPFIETFLYETSEYRDQGRLFLIDDYFGELNAVWFSAYAFILIIEEVILYKDDPFLKYHNSFGVKEGQAHKYYVQKFLPMLENETDPFERCILAYRFFVSVYDFCGLVYVGKEKIALDQNRISSASDIELRYYMHQDEKKRIGLRKYEDIPEGYSTVVSVGFASFAKTQCFQNSEVIMAVDEDAGQAMKYLGMTLLSFAREDFGFDKGFCTGNILDIFIPGFEEQHHKAGIYFMEIDKLPDDLPFIIRGGRVYMAFFVTRQEIDYMLKYGFKKFEEALRESNVDLRQLGRESIIEI